jgi:hypothetical protein
MHKAVVILQDDPTLAQNLASQIRSISDVVFVTQSLAELQIIASQFPIPIGVLNLGLVTLQEIFYLRLRLGMEIVCTHHTPDEVMWTGAMNAGALDCCFDDDGQAICRAIHRAAMFCNQTR